MTYAGPTFGLTLPANAEVAGPRAQPGAAGAALAGRRCPNSWTLIGDGGELILQGLWLQGADLVLDGHFDTVRLRLMTLDPGTAGQGGPCSTPRSTPRRCAPRRSGSRARSSR